MKVKMTDKDGVTQTRFINPKNYDPERMTLVDPTDYDMRCIHGLQ